MTQFSSTNAGIVAGPSFSDDLYLKTFSGEVMKAYNTKTVMKGRIRERTIKSGKSVQFAAMGKATAEYHTPGNVILGQDMNHGEKVIYVDDLLIASHFVSNYEEAMNHYETRAELATQAGDALAQAYDQHLFAIATKAAVDGTTGAVSEMGPATQDKIGASPALDDIVASIYDSAAYLDKTNVPDGDRVIFVTPDIYYDLVEDGRFLNRDFGNQNGSQAGGTIMRVAGMDIIKSNNLALNFGTDTLAGQRAGSAITDYTVDGSNTVALILQKQALGAVKLMNLATEKDYQVNRQGTLMVTRMASGMGVLRPDAIRLITAEDAA